MFKLLRLRRITRLQAAAAKHLDNVLAARGYR